MDTEYQLSPNINTFFLMNNNKCELCPGKSPQQASTLKINNYAPVLLALNAIDPFFSFLSDYEISANCLFAKLLVLIKNNETMELYLKKQFSTYAQTNYLISNHMKSRQIMGFNNRYIDQDQDIKDIVDKTVVYCSPTRTTKDIIIEMVQHHNNKKHCQLMIYPMIVANSFANPVAVSVIFREYVDKNSGQIVKNGGYCSLCNQLLQKGKTCLSCLFGAKTYYSTVTVYIVSDYFEINK